MNEHELKVLVIERADRAHFQLRWTCPMSGRRRTKSSGVERRRGKAGRREAEREAAKLEADLHSGRHKASSNATWDAFRQKYENEVLAGLADGTRKKCFGVLNAVERILNPQRVRDVTEARLSYLQSELREEGREEATIAGHMAHLQAALGYAADWGMLPARIKAPKIKRGKTSGKRAKRMKGRPITLEEFERMLAATDKVIRLPNHGRKPVEPGPDWSRIPSWKHLLRGLWLSGLRLTEALELSWDRPDKLCVDLDGRRPMLLIPAELEKGHQDRLLAMSPEFAEFLLGTPEHQRSGYVFNPAPLRRKAARLGEQQVGRAIGQIGKRAGVKVDQRGSKVKYASAHDLRRSFGQRWARKVMPQVLMELMRHESIETTLRYYVARNAEETADVLWEAHEATEATREEAPRRVTPK